VDIPADRGGRPVLRAIRLFFGTLAVGAFALGYWGLSLLLPLESGASPSQRMFDLIYYDMQLFVLDPAPINVDHPDYSWPLQVARFAAPLATGYALGEAAWALFGDGWRRWRSRRRRGHTIIVGGTPAAQTIALGLGAAGALETGTVVLAPDGHPTTLRAKGIARAAALYACENDATDPGVNVATVLAAAALRTRSGLRAYAQVFDPDLALALRARRIGLADAHHTRLDFFNLDEVAARLVIGAADLSPGQPRVLVAGLSTFGRAVLVEYARRWRIDPRRRHIRPEVTVVDERAGAGVAQIVAKWPFVGEVCEVHAVDGDVREALRVGLASVPTTAYLCYTDEVLALGTALTAASLWRGEENSLVVRLNILSRLGTAFTGSSTPPRRPQPKLLDDLGGRLLLVGVTENAADVVRIIQQDLVERLAQAIHEQYVLTQPPDEANPSLVAWEYLSEDRKRANRGLAVDIGHKLQAIGATVAPYSDDGVPFEFTALDLERLDAPEHERWYAERRRQGWRYGPVRDEQRKENPAMVPWDELPESQRSKDRTAISRLTAVLADVGLRIVRLREPL
jgi:hypothetical protein